MAINHTTIIVKGSCYPFLFEKKVIYTHNTVRRHMVDRRNMCLWLYDSSQIHVLTFRNSLKVYSNLNFDILSKNPDNYLCWFDSINNFNIPNSKLEYSKFKAWIFQIKYCNSYPLGLQDPDVYLCSVLSYGVREQATWNGHLINS